MVKMVTDLIQMLQEENINRENDNQLDTNASRRKYQS